MQEFPRGIRVIDSHTEGEPTRVVVSGWPELRGTTMAERRDDFAARFDHLRSGVVCEPRGHDAVVGALLTPPVSEGAACGVVFFNNTGTLGMCGHGLIGVVRTLQHLGRAAAGELRVDTPVGAVAAWLNEDDSVTIRNVPARCHALDVSVDVPAIGWVTGDVAYGGNWFFIAEWNATPLDLAHVGTLTAASGAVMAALRAQGITGQSGALIDHVELVADGGADADGINFVLCPGGAYDRSPCGTGTSAKLAVLRERGVLGPGQVWRQRSVTGGVFEAWLDEHEGTLHPFVRGRAWITAESELRFAADDPFRAGFTGRPA